MCQTLWTEVKRHGSFQEAHCLVAEELVAVERTKHGSHCHHRQLHQLPNTQESATLIKRIQIHSL